MQQIPEKARRRWSWGILASLATHAVLAALLILGLPLPSADPPKEESVSVELVAPPEEKPEEPKPEPETKAEEAAKAEPPPPPAPEEKPPEEKPPEPPPPEAQEQASAEAGKAPPLPALRPVFQFGDKDSGPKPSPDGNAAEEGKVAPTPPVDTPPEAPKPADTVAEDKPVDAPPPAEPLPPELVPAEPVPDALPADVPVPDEPVPDAGILASAGMSPEALDDGSAVQIVPAPPVPTPKPPKPQKPSQTALAALTQAKTLFSQNETDDLVATTAKGGETPGERAGQLCATELREQLRRGVRQYRPELLPSYRLNEGTVLEVPDAAFRANGEWFNISFRCTLDADVTKILSFAFSVGDPVPRRDWKRRGFPEF